MPNFLLSFDSKLIAEFLADKNQPVFASSLWEKKYSNRQPVFFKFQFFYNYL